MTPSDDEIARIVDDFLRVDVPTHKRRCAIRQGNREPVTEGCDHSDWDGVKQWCNVCGVTKFELMGGTYKSPESHP